MLSAVLIASDMSGFAGEPSIDPMADGSLIMTWLFEGASLEIVIEKDEQFPTYAMLARGRGGGRTGPQRCRYAKDATRTAGTVP